MENPKFQIFRTQNKKEFNYRLRANNGEIIFSGKGYKTKQSCQAGIAYVKKNGAIDNCYVRSDSYISYTFNLKTSNGEVIGRGETYTTRVARENGIEAVRKYFSTLTVEDLA